MKKEVSVKNKIQTIKIKEILFLPILFYERSVEPVFSAD